MANKVKETLVFFNKHFLHILLIMIGIAFFWRNTFLWAAPHSAKFIIIIMFCMGLNLDLKSLLAVFKNPKTTGIGMGLQFIFCPILAYILGKAFHLSDELLIGLVLMGACPTAVASNVMTLMANGDIALSVGLSSTSILCSAIYFPPLIKFFAGKYAEINILSIIVSVATSVIIPIILGILVNSLLKEFLKKIDYVLVSISSASLIVMIAGIVAGNRNGILESGMTIIMIILLHNIIGYIVGFYTAKFAGLNRKQQKTICIQTGIKNCGLIVGLVAANFSPNTVVPLALGMVIHQITAPMVATYFAKSDNKVKTEFSVGRKLYEQYAGEQNKAVLSKTS